MHTFHLKTFSIAALIGFFACTPTVKQTTPATPKAAESAGQTSVDCDEETTLYTVYDCRNFVTQASEQYIKIMSERGVVVTKKPSSIHEQYEDRKSVV